MKIIFVREQDYWVFPASFVGTLFLATFLYVGEIQLRLLSGLIGFATLYFVMHLIQKNYGRKLASRYMLICLISAIIGAYGVYLLTN